MTGMRNYGKIVLHAKILPYEIRSKCGDRIKNKGVHGGCEAETRISRGKKQEDRMKACGTAGGQDGAAAAGERSAAVS